jgi:hypothetical protein
MMGTANRPQLSTAWEEIDADEVSMLTLDAGQVLTPSSDGGCSALAALFDLPTTASLPRLLAQPTTSVPDTSTLRFGSSRVLLDLVEMLHGAILEEDQYRGEVATDQYLFEDQSPTEVPDDWFAELRQTKILVDKDFELPWVDG